MNKFQQKLVDERYCDVRGAGFCATAVHLPNGERGIVALCVNGNNLNVFDVHGMVRTELGEVLYSIPLSKVEGLKMRSNILSQILWFVYDDEVYHFTNFVGVKPALKVIEEESKRA